MQSVRLSSARKRAAAAAEAAAGAPVARRKITKVNDSNNSNKGCHNGNPYLLFINFLVEYF